MLEGSIFDCTVAIHVLLMLFLQTEILGLHQLSSSGEVHSDKLQMKTLDR